MTVDVQPSREDTGSWDTYLGRLEGLAETLAGHGLRAHDARLLGEHRQRVVTFGRATGADLVRLLVGRFDRGVVLRRSAHRASVESGADPAMQLAAIATARARTSGSA